MISRDAREAYGSNIDEADLDEADHRE